MNFILSYSCFRALEKADESVNRMIFPRHRISLVVEQVPGFTDGVIAQANCEPPRHPGNDSALDKPLGIDD